MEEVNEFRKSSIQYASASAFLRAFIKVTAQFFHVIKDPRFFEAESKHYFFGNILCDILARAKDDDDHNRLSSLTVYLLKCLRDHSSLIDLVNGILKLPDYMTFLKKVQFHKSQLTSRLGYNPISYVTHYKTTMNAISIWLNNHDTSQINELVTKAKSSAEHRVGLLAAITETFFFARTTTGIRAIDRMEIQWFNNKVKEMLSDSFAVLLQRLNGADRSCSFLDISDETDIRKLHQIAFVLHVACTDIVCNKMTAAFLLDTDTDRKGTNHLDGVTKADCVRMDCICGFCMVYKASQHAQDNPAACPICHRSKSQETCRLDMKEESNKSRVTEMHYILKTILDIIRTALLISRLLSNKMHEHEVHTEEAQTGNFAGAASLQAQTIDLHQSTPNKGVQTAVPSMMSNENTEQLYAKPHDCEKLYRQLNVSWMILEHFMAKESEATSHHYAKGF